MLKKLIAFIGLTVVTFTIIGCASTYIEPTHEDKKDKYTLIVNKSYDQVWTELITKHDNAYFDINDYDKNLGFITLELYADKPSDLITGGHFKMPGIINFDGDYVDALAQYNHGNLTGEMNITVLKVSENKTKIQVKATYVYFSRFATWSFETGRCQTVKESTTVLEPQRIVTVCPTYKAENSILNLVK